MKIIVKFLDVEWEVVGDIDKENKLNTLDEKYFRFLSDKKGRRLVVVRTEKWSPNKTKDSPRFRKCYGKYLIKYILPEETSIIKKLIRHGYKPESDLII